MQKDLPKLLVITSCTGKKASKPDNQLVQEDFKQPELLKSKTEKLDNYKCTAENMYTGEQHIRLMKGIKKLREKQANVDLWIVSAGYGFIGSNKEIVPYECTFDTMKAKEIDEWSKLLKIPKDFRSVLGKYDLGIVLLGKKYLRSLQIEKNEQFSIPLIFFCSQEKQLNGSNGTIYPTSIQEAKDFHCGLVGLKGEIFKRFAQHVCQKTNILNTLKKQPKEIVTILNTMRKANNSQHKKDKDLGNLPKGYKLSEKCPFELRLGLPTDYKPPKRVEIAYTPRKDAKMLYFIPEWDDRVDPRYDFINDFHYSELFGLQHDSYRDDYYSHELMKQYNYDGILVSKVTIEESKKKKQLVESLGIHAYLRCPKEVPVMGDCGAFGYLNEYNPPYTTEEIIDYYERLDFNYGVTIDHLIVPSVCQRKTYWVENKNGNYEPISKDKFESISKDKKYRVVKSPPKSSDLFDNRLCTYQKTEFDFSEAKRRWQITLDHGKEFINLYKQKKYNFKPIAACQGWDADSYTKMFEEYQQLGYSYIALGSLVRSQTETIIEILTSIDKIRKPETRIHLFGIGRLDAISNFINLGVYSCDSASQLRRAWLSARDNFWSTYDKRYSAIRVPQAKIGNPRIKKMLEQERGCLQEFVKLEKAALKALRNFDQGSLSLEETLKYVLEYDQFVGDNREKHERLYEELLRDCPWKTTNNSICEKNGIEVAIFRGNNRNRRRGFHNTHVFFQEFKQATQ
ncbi:tRNA-guanine transglycosylase DpdA [Candidatus Uabimicrobium amorphum]|uniref:DUF6884 domain-containing protein n=1 Tax=Uabimicrobium amorphum TaxID=2596890 RepID=A0A5S9F5R5_UABAM|nr:tRNA-guanine transglycosylase DpdA [Candidatus Uabimicrobium amorphum]BBM87126.1 hypothetical protein UABAM_05529 [Candidatus Uabimicrobium amorphum]